MPTGHLWVAARHVEFAIEITPPPLRVLDIGCGFGKYGVLLREYISTHPQIDGCEAWEGYVEPMRLRGIYSELHVCDALDLPTEVLDRYDLINMGDVIEHMRKKPALEFLTRCKGHVLINTPVDFFHNPADLPHTEEHVSHWTLADFQSTGRLIRHEEYLGGHLALLGPLP